MNVLRALFVAVLSLPLSGVAAEEPSPARAAPATPFVETTAADRGFLNQAVLDDMMGQAMGEQALLRPGSPRFTAHAALLRDKHGSQALAMRGLAVIRGVKPPSKLDDDRRATLDRLAAKTGRDYEAAFATAALRLHLRMVDRFQVQAREGDDPELRTVATQTLPDLMALRRASEALWREAVPVGL